MSLTHKPRLIFNAPTCATVALLSAALLSASSLSALAQAEPQAAAPKVVKRSKAPAAKKAAGDQSADAKTAAKKQDPATAQRNIDSGIKLLQSGKAEQAIQTFTSTIAGGHMPPTLMARALYQRGIAYRQTNKPAQAISDLTSALWLKGGLQDADRQDAVKQRSDAYREAGLPDQTGPDGQPAGAAGTRAARATRTTTLPPANGAPVTTASLAPDQPAAAAQPSAAGNFFTSLFGGGPKTAAPEPAAPPAQRQAQMHKASPVTSGWSSEIVASKPAAPARPVRTASAAKPAAVAPPPAAATPAAATPVAAPREGVHARIALVRSDSEAQTVIAKLMAQHTKALGDKTPAMSKATFGGMGAFYQVRVGPYASINDAKAFCQKLTGSGLDCVPVDR